MHLLYLWAPFSIIMCTIAAQPLSLFKLTASLFVELSLWLLSSGAPPGVSWLVSYLINTVVRSHFGLLFDLLTLARDLYCLCQSQIHFQL